MVTDLNKAIDMIEELIAGFGKGLDINLNSLKEKIIKGIEDVPDLSLYKILDYATMVCASAMIYEPDLSVMATRIQLHLLYKSTPDNFCDAMSILHKDDILCDRSWAFILKNSEFLNKIIDHSQDDKLTYHGIDTLKKSYLLKDHKGNIIERPQYMYMRVAVGVAGDDIKDVELTYNLLSEGLYIHATPTLYSAATKHSQMASCFLFPVQSNDATHVLDSLSECIKILHKNGGIGLHLSKISNITANSSRGLVNLIRLYNNVVKYSLDNLKRPNAITMYLEPWHCGIYDFVDVRKNNGADELRARDIFTALWIPDLFMERVITDEKWSLMCPSQSPGLDEVYGDEFVKLYTKYEKEGKYIRQVNARELWRYICLAQIETGNPSILYKDQANEKSNHKHLGTIKGSNLCTEIIEYSDCNETAVCNLASLALPRFVRDDKQYSFSELKFVTKVVVRNLNNIIDTMEYPTESAKMSNQKHRPIGLGVQGLADVFMMMNIPYESERARELNKQIFETIYYAALEESCMLASTQGPYPSYKGSPAHQGLLQFDLWNVTPTDLCDWSTLSALIKQHGLRNSLLTTLMPTASTAQILANTESFEPITSNIYHRMVVSGEYQVINKYLYKTLKDLNLWDKVIVDSIILNNGSISHLNVPDEVKSVYKTVWEMSMKNMIEMASDRGPFIDQSQSFNLYFTDPTFVKLNKAMFYSWRKGLKTAMYYLRCKPAVEANKITCHRADNGCCGC